MRAFIAIIAISSQIAGELEPPLEFAERSLHRTMTRGDGDRRNGRRLSGHLTFGSRADGWTRPGGQLLRGKHAKAILTGLCAA
jgi:hypothetical protein